ncbi:hypothetical protein JHK82_032454 [Glycine max]|nr:hypothetical protein JHK85_033164 [Glycine max]KAG4984860.1 hypothetical protein JHK86_032551 [Glycine max]KAG5118034.1 hypothetical protein JHK82_032454 [Glycine max]
MRREVGKGKPNCGMRIARHRLNKVKSDPSFPSSMAALTVGHCCCSKRVPSSHHEFTNRSRSPRIFILSSCHGRTPDPKEKKDDHKMGEGKLSLLKWKMLNDIEKVGKRVKQNLSPQQKQKGDWKDLLLMSISFAVYVYISQMLVCAYFAWTSMPKPIW